MSACRRHAFQFFAFLLPLGCVSFGMGQDRSRMAKEPTAPARLPLERTAIPYHGWGTVEIIDDGTIILELGGERILDEEGENTGRTTPRETIGFRLPPERVRVVRSGKQVFLDQTGEEIAARGISLDEVNIMTLRRTIADSAAGDRFLLVAFSGLMELNQDPATGTMDLMIKDEDRHGWTLDFEARLPGTEGSESTGSDRSASSDGIPMRIPITMQVLANMASCQVACTAGSCAINCAASHYRAECSCEGNVPKCECVRK